MFKLIAQALKLQMPNKTLLELKQVSEGTTQSYIAKLENETVFVKVASNDWYENFVAEAKSLKFLDHTATVCVPKPHYYGYIDSYSYLVLDYIELLPHTAASHALLGTQLARMHLTKMQKVFGFPFSNTIGATKQLNPWTSNWIEFFRLYRLEYQLDLLQKTHLDQEIYSKGMQLCQMLPIFFEHIQIFPSLLHGDLWNGNTACTIHGEPVIYDPASYVGHYEADLCMMEMFGGFSSSFFQAYHRLLPKETGFEKRQLCYQLYHYLNHYNIFGTAYREACLSILQQLVQ